MLNMICAKNTIFLILYPNLSERDLDLWSMTLMVISKVVEEEKTSLEILEF